MHLTAVGRDLFAVSWLKANGQLASDDFHQRPIQADGERHSKRDITERIVRSIKVILIYRSENGHSKSKNEWVSSHRFSIGLFLQQIRTTSMST